MESEARPRQRLLPTARDTDRAAFFGAVLIGVILPCLLVWIHNHGNLQFDDLDLLATHVSNTPIAREYTWSLRDLGILWVYASIGCGFFVLFQMYWLKERMHRLVRSGMQEREIVFRGMKEGVAVSFANIAGYGCAAFLAQDLLLPLRVFALFGIAGATCGVWIAWQALCAFDTARPRIPRFSLQKLMAFVVAWALLLTLFAPK